MPPIKSDRLLEQRFGLKRIVFVGDRGMVTSQNLEDLRGNGHGYIVGRNRRRSGEVFVKIGDLVDGKTRASTERRILG